MFSKPDIKTKQLYRTRAKKIRKSLDISLISNDICNRISDFDICKKAGIIAAFYSFGHEVNITRLFQDFSKQWYLPRVINATDMVFYNYKPDTIMKKNRFGIYEPLTGKELNPQKLDIIFVPALIIDKKGHRLGYGKGYYDKFLSKLPLSCIKIAPIPEELIVKELPCSELDVPVDFAITQNNIYSF